MARIYKESRYVLQLLIGKSYDAQYDDVKISFYTKNPSNQVMVDDNITIKRNIAEVKIESTLFDNLEEGLIKYIVYGTKDGIPFIEERISNYFLKTPLDFKPGENPDEEGEGVIRVWRASELLNMYNNSETLDYGRNYYVGGQITDITYVNTQYGDAKYTLDNGFLVYKGKWIDGNGFSSEDQIKVGACVVVYGVLKDYNGQLELDRDSQVIAYQECEGGSCNLGETGLTLTTEDIGTYELLASDEGYDGWSKITLTLEENTVGVTVYSAKDVFQKHSQGWVVGIGNYSYVYGKITEIQEVSIDAENNYATYIIDDCFKVGKGKCNYDTTTQFESKDQIKVGATVVVYGIFQDNNGSLQFEEGSSTIIVYQECKPKINLQETGLKLGYSSFTEVPEWADFDGITNMAYMFYECNSLETIPLIDTSNVTGMSFMFGHCHKLQTIPLIDTSNVIYMNNMFSFCIELQTIPLINTSNVTRMDSMFSNCSLLQTIPQIDTSNVTDMSHMFDNCFNLQTIPSIDTSNVTEMNYMFTYCQKLQTLPKFNCQKVTDMTRYFTKTSGGMSSLTDVGGWENLKCNWDDVYGLATCPNLTYQSCINILNGLYDFVGNGSTETRTLRVHPNFLTTVGDEISIGTNKGWQITA